MIKLVNLYLKQVQQKFQNIKLLDVRIPASKLIVLYYNSIGTYLFQKYIRYDFFVEYTSLQDRIKNSYYCDFSLQELNKGLLNFGDQLFWLNLKNKISENITLDSLEGYKIILAPSVVEDVLVSGVLEFCEGQSILSGISTWKTKLNSRIADERFSMYLDPYHKNVVCGERITDYGTISKPFIIIDKGILKIFILSRKEALQLNMLLTPNTSDSVIISCGQIAIKDIFANTKKGIIISRYSGGEISQSGDFSGLAKNCYLVKNGKICANVNDVRIFGNLFEMLNGIGDISADFNNNGNNVIPWIEMKSGIHLECD